MITILKTPLILLAAASLISTAGAATTASFNTSGSSFTGVPDITGSDLANGITPTFIFISGNEIISNGSIDQLTDGLQASTGFDNGGVNTGNGPGLALYTFDLGSIQAIDSVNVFTVSSGPGATNSIRLNHNFTIFGHDSALDFGTVDLTTATLDDNTTPLTSIETVFEEGTDAAAFPGALFGATTTTVGNQEFQFITIAANPNGTAGGGESSIFSEVDIIQGVAIPEPSSTLLLGLAAMGFVIRRRR